MNPAPEASGATKGQHANLPDKANKRLAALAHRLGSVAADVPLSVTMMLADAAQAAAGKLYILGGGWSIAGPDPFPSAVALYIRVPWELTDEQHHLLLELVDGTGEPLFIQADDENLRPMRVESVLDLSEAKAKADVEPCTELDIALAINLGPIPLPPDGSYAWRLSINGETDQAWRLPFKTRPLADEGTDAPGPGGLTA